MMKELEYSKRYRRIPLVQISDFGQSIFKAELTDNNGLLVKTNLPEAGGTPGYMAPELRAWHSHKRDSRPPYSHKVDSFSLGLVFYYIISGIHALSDSEPCKTPGKTITNSLLIGSVRNENNFVVS